MKINGYKVRNSQVYVPVRSIVLKSPVQLSSTPECRERSWQIKLTTVNRSGTETCLYEISWQAPCNVPVDVEYSFDGGINWSVISKGIPSRRGKVYWNTVRDISAGGMIRMVSKSEILEVAPITEPLL